MFPIGYTCCVVASFDLMFYALKPFGKLLPGDVQDPSIQIRTPYGSEIYLFSFFAEFDNRSHLSKSYAVVRAADGNR